MGELDDIKRLLTHPSMSDNSIREVFRATAAESRVVDNPSLPPRDQWREDKRVILKHTRSMAIFIDV